MHTVFSISIPIWVKRDDRELGPATAFFMKRNGKVFLVSNWHVFSGRNAYTGQPLSTTLLTPNRISYWAHTPNIGKFVRDCEVAICDQDDEPKWLQHPLGQKIDLACIELRSFPSNLKAYTPEDIGDQKIMISVGQDVVIAGFPKGMMQQGILPIWKRGSIAAEPNVARNDGLGVYLVDTATREGMSGSPVYLFSNGTALMEDRSVTVFSDPVARFLGVYSGRYGAEAENEIQLGRVWAESHLLEMLDDPKVGSYEIINNR